jgi:hypothetical protein
MQPDQVLSNLLETGLHWGSSLLTPGCLQLTPLPSNVQYASSLHSLLKTESAGSHSGNLSKKVARRSQRLRYLRQSERQRQEPASVHRLHRALGGEDLTYKDQHQRRASWMGGSSRNLLRAYRANRLMAPAESVAWRRGHSAANDGCQEQGCS